MDYDNKRRRHVELLTESAALEIQRLNPTQVIARDDKGTPSTAIAELTKKLGDLKGGKAHLERFKPLFLKVEIATIFRRSVENGCKFVTRDSDSTRRVSIIHPHI